jgi:hypothetical protein
MSESSIGFVAAVKKHALENYEASFGWSEVIECYSDDDIANLIETACTEAEAIKIMGEVVGIRDERYREAIGPDVKCPTCACPRC